MSYERFTALVREVCGVLEIPDADQVLANGYLTYRNFEYVLNCYYESDPDALYVGLNFGVVLAGRTLRIYRLMLEANLAVYAQDQAMLGLDGESGTVRLVVRLPMLPELDGAWLANTFNHYAEHGNYWRQNLITSPDDMFAGLCSGDYRWIRA